MIIIRILSILLILLFFASAALGPWVLSLITGIAWEVWLIVIGIAILFLMRNWLFH